MVSGIPLVTYDGWAEAIEDQQDDNWKDNPRTSVMSGGIHFQWLDDSIS